jgi:hypothetical protein
LIDGFRYWSFMEMDFARKQQFLLALADEAARRAEQMNDPKVQAMMREVAELYSQLARQADELRRMRAAMRRVP